MYRKTHNFRVLPVIALVLGAVASSAQTTQNDGPQANDAGNSVLTADLVRTGLFVISGAGGNSLLRLTANGLILVDGKRPCNYKALVTKARKLSFSDQPIRALITTDYHIDHTGNNAEFLAAGTQIFAQENVKQNLITNNLPDGRVAPPTITYDRDYTLRLGGIEARLLHFGHARTDGDTVVYFANLKVVAVGDLFAPIPDPDFSAGGSLVGWGPVLGEVLKLDFDIAVPGAGPIVTKADVAAFKNKIDTLVSRATGLVDKGVPRDRLMSELKTDDLGWKFSFTKDQLDHFYSELSGTK